MLLARVRHPGDHPAGRWTPRMVRSMLLTRTHGRVVVTKHGQPAAVMLNVDDLESLEETLAILSNPTLRDAVLEGADDVPPAALNASLGSRLSLASRSSDIRAIRNRVGIGCAPLTRSSAREDRDRLHRGRVGRWPAPSMRTNRAVGMRWLRSFAPFSGRGVLGVMVNRLGTWQESHAMRSRSVGYIAAPPPFNRC
jgi:hypothetical protein